MYQVQISTSKGTVIGNELISDPLCRIGKASDNHIVLHGWQVGKCHASLRLVGADVYLDDLGTGGGTRVNGQRIETYGPLSSEDVIEIHSYLIRIKPPTNRYLGANDPQGADVPAAATSAPHKAAVAASQSAAAEAGTVERPTSPVPPPAAAPRPPAAPETAAPVEGEEQSKIGALTVEWRRRLHKSLLEQMDLRRMAVNQMSHEALRRATEDLLESILTQTDLPRELSRAALKKQVVDEAVGLGPLE